MTRKYTHELTPMDTACGVTLPDVAALLPQVLLIDNGGKVVLPVNTGPALASSTARCAFAGGPVEFAGLNQLGQPVYRRI